MTDKEILEMLDDKLTDLEIAKTVTRCSDNYYLIVDAKIEVMEEMIRRIEEMREP